MNVQEKFDVDGSLGLYVHVPFCSSTCDFCAFYQKKPSKNSIKIFLEALDLEFLRVPSLHSVDTIFFGGGTPGVLTANQLTALCQMVAGRVGDFLEWTVELAPIEVTDEKLKVLKDFGVNRISLGIQTFDSVFLKELGRNHPPDKALRAYEMIRWHDFESVNVDLLFGAPNQELSDWEKDLRTAVDLEPDHVSTYCLTFEEDTAIYARLSKGEIKIDREREAAFYKLAWEFLPSCGLCQYEVSNYALEGKQCLHNINTWLMEEWVGCGPSAASQFAGKRFRNLADLDSWAEALQSGRSPPREEEVVLDHLDLARDAILFGLRLNQGINPNSILKRFSLPLNSLSGIFDFLNQLVDGELACKSEQGNYYLTGDGRMLADAIMNEMPELSEVSLV